MTPFELMKKEPVEFSRIAKEAGTSPEYFEQIARGYSNSSIKLGKKLVEASKGELTLAEVIPALQFNAA